MASSYDSLDIALSPTNISEIKVLLRPEAPLIPFALRNIVNYFREKHVSDSLPLGSTKATLTRMAISRQGDTASVDLSWSHAEHGPVGSAGHGQLKYNSGGGAPCHQVLEVDSKVAEGPKDSSSDELVNPARAVQLAIEGANGHQSNSSAQYDAANGDLANDLLQIGNCGAARSMSPVCVKGVRSGKTSSEPPNPSVSHEGGYACKHPRCELPPFETKYLLRSHAIVHTQNRPFHCPREGCDHSIGGKDGTGGVGFKRKNERSRHGLVHKTRIYCCPYCPEKSHAYPRPDNLQRHVRIRHANEPRDEGLLRAVLNQRPEGGVCGRRRRLSKIVQ